jgi:hypothetical protein
MEQIVTTEPQSRGDRSESLVHQALERIVKTNVLKIIEFRKSERYSYEDRRGKDFIIKLEEAEISIDVKSGDKAAQRFVNHGKHRHKVLPVIVVYDHDTIESVVSRLIEIIRIACEMAKRAIAKIKGAATIRKKKFGRICHQNFACAH